MSQQYKMMDKTNDFNYPFYGAGTFPSWCSLNIASVFKYIKLVEAKSVGTECQVCFNLLVLLTGTDLPPNTAPWQRWVVQTFESPVHETIPGFFNGKANWTFSYHTKSEIQWRMGFYVPRGKYDKGPYFIPAGNAGKKYITQLRATSNNFAMKEIQSNKKEKGVLWIVSNCGPKKRKAYVKELKRMGLKIDIFGGCGKPDPCKRNTTCLHNIFAKYSFYLAFENSQCEDYISEKTWKMSEMGYGSHSVGSFH